MGDPFRSVYAPKAGTELPLSLPTAALGSRNSELLQGGGDCEDLTHSSLASIFPFAGETEAGVLGAAAWEAEAVLPVPGGQEVVCWGEGMWLQRD